MGKFKHLVLDAAPLLSGEALRPYMAENFWTVPGVLVEIKDAAAKARLASLPFHLQKRSPKPGTLSRVIAFTQKTGDYASLSGTDLRVIALAVELEEEKKGSEIKMELVTAKKKEKDEKESNKALPEAEKENSESVEKLKAEANEYEEDFEGEWITPENFKKHELVIEEMPSGLVGCITSDFAVQNVLLQLKLHLYSSDGKRIKMVKSWLMRCHACYWTTLDTKKKFCGKCGGLTLTKTSYRVDASGQRHLFLRPDYQYNLRGTKYSLPNTQGGREAQSLILREDQREYQRALKFKKRQEEKMARDPEGALDEYLEKAFGEAMRGLGRTCIGNKGNYQAGNIQVGVGKRNPNEKRKKY